MSTTEHPDAIRETMEAMTGRSVKGWSAWAAYLEHCSPVSAQKCLAELLDAWSAHGRDPRQIPTLADFQALYRAKYRVSGPPAVCGECRGTRSVIVLGLVPRGEGPWRERFAAADLAAYCAAPQTQPLRRMAIPCPCVERGPAQEAYHAQQEALRALCETYGGSRAGMRERVYALSYWAAQRGCGVEDLLRAAAAQYCGRVIQ